MIVLTDKDIKILNIISEYGSMYVEDTKIIYSENQYYRRRLRKLMDENYLLRKNRILYLGARGKHYFEEQGMGYRNIGTDSKLRKRAAEMYSLFSKLQEFTLVPSFNIKRIVKSYAYKYFGKVINNDGKEYWLYRIGKVVLKENDEEGNARKLRAKNLEILRLKNEIEEIRAALKQINLMIFVDDKISMDKYKELVGNIPVNEHIILPYVPSGLFLVNKYIGKGEGDNNKVLEKLHSLDINAKNGHSSWSTADFDIDGMYAINLTTNDYNKEVKLLNYISLTNRPENICIVCSGVQEKKYENEYPKSKIIIID